MEEQIKYPNPYNSGAGKAFCRKAACPYQGKCFLAFNSVVGGREMRLDFNHCNLHCRLCWSDNEAPELAVEAKAVFERFAHCISMKDDYLNHRYPGETVKQDEAFRTRGIQIIGGEPLLTQGRFAFLLDLLQRMDDHLGLASTQPLVGGTKKGFVVKIFTNGITIGQGLIGVEDLRRLEQLKRLDIRVLLSLKGLNQRGVQALQAKPHTLAFDQQVQALEALLDAGLRRISLELVLGFYHSAHFNIQAPGLTAEQLFSFDSADACSIRLQRALQRHLRNRGKFFVEPIHPIEQTQKGQRDFLGKYPQFLSADSLLEPLLKSGGKQDFRKTRLGALLGGGLAL